MRRLFVFVFVVSLGSLGVVHADPGPGEPPVEAAVGQARIEGQQVKLSATLGFVTGSAEVQPESAGRIVELVDILGLYSNMRLRIEVHSDSRGSGRYNLTLTSQRAKAIKAALVKNGVAAARIEAIGYGEDRPLVKGSSAKNRRVEFHITGW